MKKLGMVVAVVGAVALGLEEAEAQVSFGAQASYAENTDLGIGARIYVGLPVQGAEFVGTFDHFFPRLHNVDYCEVNANVLLSQPAPNMPGFRPYFGAGLNIAQLTDQRSRHNSRRAGESRADELEHQVGSERDRRNGVGHRTPPAVHRVEGGDLRR